jgi:hypothetical protein
VDGLGVVGVGVAHPGAVGAHVVAHRQADVVDISRTLARAPRGARLDMGNRARPRAPAPDFPSLASDATRSLEQDDDQNDDYDDQQRSAADVDPTHLTPPLVRRRSCPFPPRTPVNRVVPGTWRETTTR